MNVGDFVHLHLGGKGNGYEIVPGYVVKITEIFPFDMGWGEISMNEYFLKLLLPAGYVKEFRIYEWDEVEVINERG